MAQQEFSETALTQLTIHRRETVGELRLAKRALRNCLGNFLAEAGTDDPRQWARRIVVDRALWPLAFNKWEFEDGGVQPDTVFIGEVQTDLPVVDDDETRAYQGAGACRPPESL